MQHSRLIGGGDGGGGVWYVVCGMWCVVVEAMEFDLINRQFRAIKNCN